VFGQRVDGRARAPTGDGRDGTAHDRRSGDAVEFAGAGSSVGKDVRFDDAGRADRGENTLQIVGWRNDGDSIHANRLRQLHRNPPP
jgi:hypothetical protein